MSDKMTHMATASLNFDRFLPEGQTLFDFQQVGVAYALDKTQDGKGCFIADEQGLGKTRQAIVTAKVHAAIRHQAPKVLIVCKASLRGNWARECGICAPEWDTQVLVGTRPYEVTGNVAIISFNLLHRWAAALIEEGFTSLLIDESHTVKDAKTQQTKGAIKVADDVRSRRGLVLLLSGTPLLNRPIELVSQLRLIGRLEDVSPAPKGKANPTLTDYEWAFKNTYCYSGRTQWGVEYKGARYLDLLNTRLRSSGYVRRLRNKVLDMTDAHRVPVHLSLNGDLDPYFQVEEHFVPKNDASAALELLTALRQSVAQCKIPAAVEWVQTFIEENPGKKLVAWAWHIEVQQGLAAALNASGIEAIYLKGEQDKGRIEEAKARFNEGTAQVIVCSLQAHREGHTLLGDGTNVTDSLFVEQPWHPGAVSQAEDRISRIGRKADVVFAHTLIVPGTVDVWLADLIAEKWSTFRAAADGSVSEAETKSLTNEVLAKLRAHLLAKYGEDRLPQQPQGDIIP